jgi:hypothetical protein
MPEPAISSHLMTLPNYSEKETEEKYEKLSIGSEQATTHRLALQYKYAVSD